MLRRKWALRAGTTLLIGADHKFATSTRSAIPRWGERDAHGLPSPERPRTDLVHRVVAPHVLIGTPEPHLLGPAHVPQAATAQRQDPRRAGRDHAEATEIPEIAGDAPHPLADDAARRPRADARDPHQLPARSRPHLDRKPLRMR